VTEHLLPDFVIVAYLKSAEQIFFRFMAWCLDISTAIVLENLSLAFQHFSWSTAGELAQAATHPSSVWEVPSPNPGDENLCPYCWFS
jgi:hypothetical protein